MCVCVCMCVRVYMCVYECVCEYACMCACACARSHALARIYLCVLTKRNRRQDGHALLQKQAFLTEIMKTKRYGTQIIHKSCFTTVSL